MLDGLTVPEVTFYVALLGALVTLGNGAVGRKHENDARRRDLYSKAYQSALEWCEGVYRVRRRKPDRSQDYDLVEHFHALQEKIAFYEGWLSTESIDLGQAYRELLRAVRKECEPLLQDAWSRDGRPPTEPRPDDEADPDVRAAKSAFCDAVRRHMSPWWNPAKPDPFDED